MINYSTIEKKAPAIMYSLKTNRTLCPGYPIIVHTDYRPLVWLLTTSNANSRIARWQLLIAEFDIKVEYIPGKKNKVADCLSRLRHQEESLEDENICVVTEEKADMYLEWDFKKNNKIAR